jgi:hypothetical protein
MDLFLMFRQMPSDPTLKAAILTTELDMRFYKTGYSDIPTTLKEVISLGGFSLCVPKNNFYSSLSHKVMNKLISGGIPQYLIDFYTKFELRPMLTPRKDLKVFDVDDLMFGFIIWLVACGISITVFIIELTVFYVKSFVGVACLMTLLKSKIY